jgi:hypothetical protein
MIKTIFRTFLLGLGVGVLVAPRPGSETRQMLSERFGRLFGGADGDTRATEWDRPLSDSFGVDITPSQHYTPSPVDAPTTSSTYGSTTGSTTLADTDIGGSTANN